MTRPRSKPIEAPADSSVNDEVERVTRHLRAENESDKTVVTYREAVDQLLHHLTDRGMPTTPEHIRREHVEAFIVSLLERFKLAAASARYRALQVFFKWLVEEDVIETSPMVHMKPPKVPEQPAPALSIAELKALVATCEKGRSFEDRRDPALLRVFIDTGARLSEVAGLRFDLAQDSASGCGRFVGLRYAPRCVAIFGAGVPVAWELALGPRHALWGLAATGTVSSRTTGSEKDVVPSLADRLRRSGLDDQRTPTREEEAALRSASASSSWMAIAVCFSTR